MRAGPWEDSEIGLVSAVVVSCRTAQQFDKELSV
jgi:hypothetical protein